VIAISLAIAYGVWYSYSVFLVALLAEFGWSRSVLAGAFGVFTLVHGAVNPVIGMLCARFRPLRVIAVGGAAMGATLFLTSFIATPLGLYFCFGVLTAAAVALAGWVPSLVFVQRNFHERLGLSVGIISSGVGVGMLLVVPLTQVLIDAFGWRAAFRVLGVIAVAWIVPSSLWLRTVMLQGQVGIRGQSPNSRDQKQNSGSDPEFPTLREALRTREFWLLMAMFYFGNVASQTLHVHQVAYLVDQGLAAIAAAWVVGVVGFSSIVGKTSSGWLADKVERELVYVSGIAILVASAFALLAIQPGSSVWAAYGYAALLGVGYSVTATITPVMASDRFGGPNFGAIVGVGLMGTALGSASGPWLAGRLYDATGSYTLAFMIAAGAGVAAGAACWYWRVLRLRRLHHGGLL
jgi:MFS family permease